MKGYNTDGQGFRRAIKESFGLSVAGLSVFVIGTGGAGRAVAITCATDRAGMIALTDVETAGLKRVAQEIRRIRRSSKVEVIPQGRAAWIEACRNADLVVQATPVGMKKDAGSLLPSRAFHKGQMVFDLVYMYPATALMRAARRAGAEVANGLGMLTHQGAASFEIWTGKRPPVKVMRKALEKAVYGKKHNQ